MSLRETAKRAKKRFGKSKKVLDKMSKITQDPTSKPGTMSTVKAKNNSAGAARKKAGKKVGKNVASAIRKRADDDVATLKDDVNFIAETGMGLSRAARKAMTPKPKFYTDAHPGTPMGKIRNAHRDSAVGKVKHAAGAPRRFEDRMSKDFVGTVGDIGNSMVKSSPVGRGVSNVMKGVKNAAKWLNTPTAGTATHTRGKGPKRR